MKNSLLKTSIILATILFSCNVAASDIGSAKKSLQEVMTKGHFVSELKPGNTANITPIGMRHTMGNVTVTLAVSRIKNKKEYCIMDVYAKVLIPSRDEANLSDSIPLFFGAEGIKISYDGDIVGDVRLVLLEDIRIPILNHNAAITLRERDTYATLSCQGITGFGLAADVMFPKSLIQLADENGNATGNEVSTSFKLQTDNLEEWLVSVNLPRFAVTGLDGYSFACENIIFDYSANKNGSMRFPKDYRNNYLQDMPDINMWEGFYAERILVSIPEHFNGGNRNSGHLTFSATDLLIDDNGISGVFAAETSLLDFGKGSASGWRFSIDRFRFALIANTLTQAAFSGHIGIPLGNQDKAKLAYEGMWDIDNHYVMTVAVDSTITFDVLQAQANLFEGSYVKLEVRDRQFRPEANLSGSLNLAMKKDSTAKDTLASFTGIVFQNLHIQTEVPYVTTDYLGYQSTTQMLNLPVSISELGLTSTGTALNFYAGLRVDLKEGSGNTRFSIIGDLENNSGIHQWKFKQFRIDDIMLDMNVAKTFSLKGRISARYDDPIYGDGFAGYIKLGIETGLKFSIEASAAFGKKDGMQYWYVDAGAEFDPPIPCAGYVNIGGFAGGASYGMRRNAAGVTSANAYDYVPSADAGLGFKAGLTLVIPARQTASLKLMLEMQFSRYGGLTHLGLYGHGEFLSSQALGGLGSLKELIGKADALPQNVTDNQKAAEINAGNAYQNGIVADIAIEYDHQNRSFHSNFEVYINFLEGFFRGIGNGGLAGWVVLHIDENDWYLHLGTPTNPIGVELNAVDLVRIQTRSYLMAGHHIPSALPVPSEITQILPHINSELSIDRENTALKNGRGFAFGANLSVDTGDLFFLLLYARFQAGLGFDIMLREYPNAQCAGRSGTVGMDGWYAMGQVYAYLAGELGVGVNLWFIKAKFPIIKGGTAAILQGMLPNPTWFAGALGVKFELLGGLIKGNMNFKFELGEKCNLLTPGQSPVEMEIIGDITPSESGTDVFAVPQVAFNMSMEKSFDTKLDDKPVKMKTTIDQCTVKNANTGAVVEGKWQWNDDRDKYSFYPVEILEPNTQFVVNVNVGFVQYNNGTWETVYTAGEKSQEKREVSFTTGDAPNHIPEHNIEYMYPVKGQQNLYVAEHASGFIKLKRGQSYLFADTLAFYADFTTQDGKTVSFSKVDYNAAAQTVMFQIPQSTPMGTPITLLINGKLKNAKQKSVESSAVYTSVESGGGNVTKKQNVADENYRDDIGSVILSYDFRTSIYKTFKSKLSAINPTYYYWDIDGTSTRLMLGIQTNSKEPFDNAELSPTEFCPKPLVSAVSAGTDKYYTKDIEPYLYRGFNERGLELDRDTAEVGVPPLRAVLVSPYYQYMLDAGNTSALVKVFPFLYKLHWFYRNDYFDLLNRAVDRYVNGEFVYKNYVNTLEQHSVPPLRKDNYSTFISYTLPNGTITSTEVVKFKYR